MAKFKKNLGTIDSGKVTEVIFSILDSNEFVTKFQTFFSGLEIVTFMSLKSKTESVSCGRDFYSHSHKEVVAALKKDFKDIIEHSISFPPIEGLITVNAEIEGEYETFCYEINFIME